MKNLHRFRTLSRQAKKNIVVRYALFQIPDVLILALVLMVLQRWVKVSSVLAWGLVTFWLVKDIVMFPFFWRAYEEGSPDARQDLIGAEGIAEEKLAPAGYIRVHGVLWRAQVVGQGTVLQKGDALVVDGVSGLLLTVRPKEEKGETDPRGTGGTARRTLRQGERGEKGEIGRGGRTGLLS